MARSMKRSNKSMKRSNKSRKSRNSKNNKSKSKVRKSRNSKNNKAQSVSNKNISLKNPNQPLVGYCVVCKAKGQKMNNCQFFRNPNGSVRVAGVCQVCGTKMNTFMGADKFN